MRRALVALVWLAAAPALGQQPELPEGVAPEPAARDERETAWAVLPGLFYSQETSLGFALVGMVSFYPEGEGSTSQASRILMLSTYTLNKQISAVLLPQLRLSDDDWLISGSYELTRYPDRFYGIGNDTPNLYQRYTPRFGAFETEVQRALADQIWVGLLHQALIYDLVEVGAVYDDDDSEIDADPILEATVPGAEGGLTNGFGLSFIFDTRDNVYVPETGTYLYTSLIGFARWLGSDYPFGRWVVDLRQIVLLIPSLRHVLALRLLSEVSIGEPPFYQMPEVGGPVVLRGYFQGRFRDANMIVLQAEYRLPIVWRLSAAVFGDIGEVYGRTPFRFDRLIWTAGGGIRLLIGADVIVRADVGFGRDAFGFILDVGYPF